MGLFTCSLLCLFFTWLMLQAFNSFGNGSKSSDQSKLPPGPRRLPVFGNLFDLGDKPHRSLAKLAHIHGPVMSFKLSSLLTVVVSSEAAAKEILQKQDLVFSNRAVVDAVRASRHHEVSLAWIPVSPLWRTLRKVLFVAGTDTTSNTLEWAMAELIRNPQVLLKAKAELEQAIGKRNPVEESDINRLPYLQAIVKETFRMHPALPLLLPHKVSSDANVCGFRIPEGSQVLVNVWATGRDPRIWENPNSFMPARFLGSGIDVKGRDFGLITFGAGRRICPGLPLANRMLHLMLGSLANAFGWKLEGGISPDEMNMEERFGLSVQMAEPLRTIPVLALE